MKKVITFIACLMVLLIASTAVAHELWIEVGYSGDELQADVSWGHIFEFYDPLDHEEVKLFVRYPDGKAEGLELQNAGDQARAFVTPRGEGEYVFWAMLNPSTSSPNPDVTRLSLEMAKAVFVHGDGPATSTAETGLPFEIIPDKKMADVTTSTFSGQVILEGQPLAAANVAALGLYDTLIGETAADGSFSFSIPQTGYWLIKVSGRFDEEGTLGDTAYTQVARTSTLYINIVDKTATAPSDTQPVETGAGSITASETPAASADSQTVAMDAGKATGNMLILISILLLAASAALFFAARKMERSAN